MTVSDGRLPFQSSESGQEDSESEFQIASMGAALFYDNFFYRISLDGFVGQSKPFKLDRRLLS